MEPGQPSAGNEGVQGHPSIKLLTYLLACVAIPRTVLALSCLLYLVGGITGAWAASGDRPRRVLIVHSFGGSTPPFTTHSSESKVVRIRWT